MFLPPDVLEWALNVVVVRSGGRTILIDAGMGVEFPDLPRAGRLAISAKSHELGHQPAPAQRLRMVRQSQGKTNKTISRNTPFADDVPPPQRRGSGEPNVQNSKLTFRRLANEQRDSFRSR